MSGGGGDPHTIAALSDLVTIVAQVRKSVAFSETPF
jgi:hypothetical protein